MSALVVRAARPEEHEAVGELCLAAYAVDALATPRYEHVLRDVATRAATAEVLVAVDPDDGALLGTVTFVGCGGPLAEIARPGEAEFRMLATAPAARGRGVGETLTRACLERAAALGHHALVCSSRPQMTAAHRLYARLGFARAPERDWSPVPDVPLEVFTREVTP